MREVLWVALGGAAGSVGRYLLSGAVQSWTGPGFPYGILAVNAIGSFLMGLMIGIAPETPWLSPTARLALTTGVLGGFTTFSAFAGDTLLAIEGERYGMAIANIAASVITGLVACALGALVARSAMPV